MFGLRAEERHTNHRGTIQGGLLSTFADFALGRAIEAGAEDGKDRATVSLTVDFLRPAQPGDWIESRTRVERVGGTLSFADVSLIGGRTARSCGRGPSGLSPAEFWVSLVTDVTSTDEAGRTPRGERSRQGQHPRLVRRRARPRRRHDRVRRLRRPRPPRDRPQPPGGLAVRLPPARRRPGAPRAARFGGVELNVDLKQAGCEAARWTRCAATTCWSARSSPRTCPPCSTACASSSREARTGLSVGALARRLTGLRDWTRLVGDALPPGASTP